MKIITVDDSTPQGKARLAQIKRPIRKVPMNPFPFSLIEMALYGVLRVIEAVARILVQIVAYGLKCLFATRR